jgi:Flp pilus assembly protein TadD
MRKNLAVVGFAALLIASALGMGSAGAVGFDNSLQESVSVSEKAVAEIQRAFDDQRYIDAAKLLDQALLTWGNDPKLTYWKGELCLVHGSYEEAFANFKSIEADRKMAGLAHEGEGIALAQLGRGDEAIIALKAAVASNPAAWHAWNVLGSELDQRHDWKGADAAYDNAISASGGAAIVLNNRGFSRMSQGRLDEAIGDFVAALQKKPDLASARNNLRLAMAMKGEYDRAVAGAGASEQAAVLNNAGFAAMIRGDYAKAKDLLNQAMKARGAYYSLAAQNLEMMRTLANDDPKGKGNASSN